MQRNENLTIDLQRPNIAGITQFSLKNENFS
jgi:hypothetical protein